jgi:hypothetical protein
MNPLLRFLKSTFVFIFSSKLFLSLSSFYLFLLFYFIANKICLFPILPIWNYLIYFFIGLIFSLFCLIASKNKKEKDFLDSVNSIKPLEFIYIPVYLGLVIISLNMGSFTSNLLEIIFLSFVIYLIWLKLENVSFFNFYWLFFGYRFYEISTEMSKYLLITKRKDVKNKKELKKLNLKRINNYTFIEVKLENE